MRVEVIGEEMNTNLLQQPYDAVTERSSRGATGAPRELAHSSYRSGGCIQFIFLRILSIILPISGLVELTGSKIPGF